MKQSRLVCSIILLLFIIILSGCTERNTSNNDKTPVPAPVEYCPSDYFPISQGSYWEYEGEGNEYASYRSEVLFSKGSLAQFSENNGGTVMTFIYEIKSNEIRRVYQEAEDYNPINMLEGSFDRNDDALVLALPLEVGTNWKTADGNQEIIALNARVTTPAGVFDDCIKIKSSYPDSTLYYYYKKDVGLVMKEFISGDTTVSSSLKRYKVL